MQPRQDVRFIPLVQESHTHTHTCLGCKYAKNARHQSWDFLSDVGGANVPLPLEAWIELRTQPNGERRLRGQFHHFVPCFFHSMVERSYCLNLFNHSLQVLSIFLTQRLFHLVEPSRMHPKFVFAQSYGSIFGFQLHSERLFLVQPCP